MSADPRPTETEQFWEGFYRERERVWSGRVNPVLVNVVGRLPAGTALDIGCGEGGDAIWLADRGWQVTAVDVSATALARAAERAAAAGVGGRIDWQRHDLERTFPTGAFDLVSAQYLHSGVDFLREQVLRSAVHAVASGGLLLIVGHAGFPPWADNPCLPDHSDHSDHSHAHFATPNEVLASLRLTAGQWHTERLESPARQATGPNGQVATLTDSVVAVRHLVT